MTKKSDLRLNHENLKIIPPRLVLLRGVSNKRVKNPKMLKKKTKVMRKNQRRVLNLRIAQVIQRMNVQGQGSVGSKKVGTLQAYVTKLTRNLCKGWEIGKDTQRGLGQSFYYRWVFNRGRG
ncbi:hypothetical protein TcasGA2_TC032903 [Tribolium castaneum]|uniref:Uncharacterized protein n=1 Tax=Tribolium castaneum TaxID=7070 RepID=A0A139WJV5_TRICA|nr:hypothetical protein TcasGA2_TC032903 [Tribolium castaneum]